MPLYPEVQRRAQAMIDAVVGTNRPPSFEDRAQLPSGASRILFLFRGRQFIDFCLAFFNVCSGCRLQQDVSMRRAVEWVEWVIRALMCAEARADDTYNTSS